MLRIFAAIVALCVPFAALILYVDRRHASVDDPRRASWRTIRNAEVICVAAVALLGLSSAAHARPSPYPPVTSFTGDRYASAQLGPEVTRSIGCPPPACVRGKKLNRRATAAQRKHWRRIPLPAPRPRDVAPPVSDGGYRASAPLSLGEGVRREAVRVIGGRPAGCPRLFCGCGASLHLFGKIIPALNLAANWLRFPRAEPAPDMAAARRGHVFVLKRHIEGKKWLVFDANSGHGRTRLHVRSIAGFTIVNPHGAS